MRSRLCRKRCLHECLRGIMRLGRLIADYRFANRLGIREIAKEIGTSPATLCRIEAGEACDAETLVKIMTWVWADEPDRKRARQ